MTTSTDGIICFGFELGEISLPWSEDGIEDWWAFVVHGDRYEPVFVSPFTEEGEWNEAEGFTEAKDCAKDPVQEAHCTAYFAERRRHEESVPPLPVEMVNSCHIDNPHWIACVPLVGREASRGYPVEFKPSDLRVTATQITKLKIWLEKHLLGAEDDEGYPYFDGELGEPAWRLGSYWG